MHSAFLIASDPSLEAYGAKVTSVTAEVGGVPT